MAEEHKAGAGSNTLDSCLQDQDVNVSKNDCEEEETEDQNLWPRHESRQWILMLFLGTCLLYCARMAMPICAVTMAATFNWSKITSGLVLGSFFWGYCFTQILGGHASDKLGGERILYISAASWALITTATPVLAQLGSHTVFLMTLARFLMGLLQGVFFPSLASLCSQRVVEHERVILMSTMNCATYVGTLLAGGLGSLLLDKCGWDCMFYATGLLSGLWALIFGRFFLKGVNPKKMELSSNSKKSLSTMRWRSLFKKSPVWAMVFAHMCNASTSYVLLSWLPTYFEESFPGATGWVYNVIPWLTAIPSALFGGYVSTFLTKRGYEVATVRKIMQFFSMGVSSLFIMTLVSEALTFPSAVIFVSSSIGLSTFSSGGVSVNVQDLFPSYAGTLYGFMNMMGAFTGLVLVSVSGYLIQVTLSWASVFALITLVNVSGLTVYLIFGDARRIDLEDYSHIIQI